MRHTIIRVALDFLDFLEFSERLVVLNGYCHVTSISTSSLVCSNGQLSTQVDGLSAASAQLAACNFAGCCASSGKITDLAQRHSVRRNGVSQGSSARPSDTISRAVITRNVEFGGGWRGTCGRQNRPVCRSGTIGGDDHVATAARRKFTEIQIRRLCDHDWYDHGGARVACSAGSETVRRPKSPERNGRSQRSKTKRSIKENRWVHGDSRGSMPPDYDGQQLLDVIPVREIQKYNDKGGCSEHTFERNIRNVGAPAVIAL